MMLTDLSLVDARARLQRREISAAELTAAHLDAIEQLNPRLNAYITVTADQARAEAAAADLARAQGEDRPLLGIPLGIKDLFCTAGIRTTAGSKILEPFVPPYESTVTANLKRDGAVFLGKTNLDEFAMGSSNMTSAYGPVESPWTQTDNRKLVPGGSSGGSAAAVSARLCLVHRHRRRQTDLWPLLPLRRRRLRLLARPPRRLRPHRGGHRHPARQHGRLRP